MKPMNIDTGTRFSFRDIVQKETGYNGHPVNQAQIIQGSNKKKKGSYNLSGRKIKEFTERPDSKPDPIENPAEPRKDYPYPKKSDIPDHEPDQLIVCIGNKAYFNLK